MPFSTPKFLSQSGLARRFLSSQALNVVVAIALFVVLWVIDWRRAEFVGILLYSVVAGAKSTAKSGCATEADRIVDQVCESVKRGRGAWKRVRCEVQR